MNKLILALTLALASTAVACEGLSVQRDPVQGVTTIGDETGAGVTITDPAPVEGAEPGTAEADPTGFANAAGSVVGVLTGNPGIGAGAGLLLSWLMAKRARKSPA